MTTETVKARRSAPLKTPNPLSEKKVRELSSALNLILADAFALYLKTKNFHWHVSGPHFRSLFTPRRGESARSHFSLYSSTAINEVAEDPITAPTIAPAPTPSQANAAPRVAPAAAPSSAPDVSCAIT